MSEFTINRDGKSIKLTPKEIDDIYLYAKCEFIREDVHHRLEVLVDEECITPEEKDSVDACPEYILDLFYDADHYWEGYWEIIDKYIMDELKGKK